MSKKEQSGYTILELIVAVVVLTIIALSIMGFYSSMIQSTFLAKRKAVASSLATNQMEYLKSLPYNNLAIAGGSIVASNPLPASFTTKVNNVDYTVKTSINYSDDAYDGCGYYPSAELKQKYCANQPAPSGAPATDSNPADYKSINVTVLGKNNLKLAEVDTKISARVAETASNTGALFVKVLDESGNPLSGANVSVINSTVSPNVSVNDSTDSNGIAIFYGLPPDTSGYDYKVTATLSGYSSLVTLPPSGTLQPTYPSLQLISQQSSTTTLTLKPQGQFSLIGEVTDLSGSPLGNAKIYIKGGYKKYTELTDFGYYYDNRTPTDIRPTSNASGIFTVDSLTPGSYLVCGEKADSYCQIGGLNYYLAAAVPYAGTADLGTVTVPTYTSSNPPAITFNENGNAYLQKVRLMLTNNSSFPRLFELSPSEVSVAAGLSNFSFAIKGANLPCGTSSCTTIVKFIQAANTYTAVCTGDGTQLSCSIDLTGASLGETQLQIQVNSNVLTLPGAPLIGGVVIKP